MGTNGQDVNGHDSRSAAAAARDGVARATAEIPPGLAGQRLDRALAEMFPEWSRSRLTAWLREGVLRVDGEPAEPRRRVIGGERVELEAKLEASGEVTAQDLPVDVRYRDDDILVVMKPAGLVVHPGAGHHDGTLQNALLHLDPSLAVLPRAGIVHRLDKDTSGLMVVARSLRAHTALVAMLSSHDVERRYEAVVTGALIAGDSIEAPIGRHRGDRLRQAVRDDDGGKRALTHYRVRDRFRAHSVVECRLETGRTHQIRVHMAHIGHPLVGDPLYGGGLKLPRGASAELIEALRGFRRQALHAEHLAFAHPVDGRAMAFDAERPADMTALIEALRADSAETPA